MASSADAPAEDPSMRLLRVGAFLSLWIMGFCGLLRLLTDFGGTLKPLVLAIMLVSLLEFGVQCWEWVFFKLKILAYVIIDKISSIVAIFFFCSIRCLAGRWSPDLKESCSRSLVYHRGQLCKTGKHFRPWEAAFAGQNILSRFLGVVLMLGIVSIAFFMAGYAVVEGVSTFKRGFPAYQAQVVRVGRWAAHKLREIPDALPLQPEQKESVRSSLDHLTEKLRPMPLMHSVEEQILANLTIFLDSTGIWATQFVFFLIYVMLFLFCPLHLNPDQTWRDRYHVDRKLSLSYKVQAMWTRLRDCVSGKYKYRPTITMTRLGSGSMSLANPLLCSNGVQHQEPNDEQPLLESIRSSVCVHEWQHRIYKIMWCYGINMVIVNCTFGFLTWALLFYLDLPLASLVGIVCFFLAFVPELGAIISILLPLPIIILKIPEGLSANDLDADPFPDWELRLRALIFALVGMILNKLLVANVLNPLIMGRSKVLNGALSDDEESSETHPVFLLFVVVMAGEIWGAVGMLISIPVVSFTRLAINMYFATLTNQDRKASSRCASADDRRATVY